MEGVRAALRGHERGPRRDGCHDRASKVQLHYLCVDFQESATQSNILIQRYIRKDTLELMRLNKKDRLVEAPRHLRFPTPEVFYLAFGENRTSEWNLAAQDIIYEKVYNRAGVPDMIDERRLRAKIGKHVNDLRRKWRRQNGWSEIQWTEYHRDCKKYGRKRMVSRCKRLIISFTPQ